MSESQVVGVMLWVFAVSFAVKSLVFSTLAAIMIRQRSTTILGIALKWHYVSIGAQAALLAALYAHYSWSWMPFRARMVIYGVATLTVVWVVVSGLVLIAAYWRSRVPEQPP